MINTYYLKLLKLRQKLLCTMAIAADNLHTEEVCKVSDTF